MSDSLSSLRALATDIYNKKDNPNVKAAVKELDWQDRKLFLSIINRTYTGQDTQAVEKLNTKLKGLLEGNIKCQRTTDIFLQFLRGIGNRVFGRVSSEELFIAMGPSKERQVRELCEKAELLVGTRDDETTAELIRLCQEASDLKVKDPKTARQPEKNYHGIK